MPENKDASFGIENPDLSEKGVPRRRSVTSPEKGAELVKELIDQNRERNKKNARIMAKYNAEKPRSQDKLDEQGLGWKSNFSTKPLPLLIDKVGPRFRKSIDSVKYLTNSALPGSVPGAVKKTEAFRREVTATCRGRRGWKDLIGSIGQENCLFGYTVPAWLDEFDWFPRFFRQDECFFPAGTKQDVSSCQVLVFREDLLIHELFAKIEDREEAKEAGWDLKAVTEAINTAMPQDHLSAGSADWERRYEDMIREANVCASYGRGAKTVPVYHLLVVEIDGKVSHYQYAASPEYTEIFSREDQFDSMADAATFFSFQQGNGTMHGSKGIGREVYAMAGILDRSRNEVVDRLLLSGKVIIQGEESDLRRFRLSMLGNVILIGSRYDVSSTRIDGDVEPFIALDNYFSALLDQIAGASSPKQLEGERVTAAQVNLFASREEESRDNILERFMSQFADMMSTIQRRLVDPHSSQDDATAFRKKMLNVMSSEELDMIAKSPVAGTVEDWTDFQRQQFVLFAAENQGNPLLDQKKLKFRAIAEQFDEQTAEDLMLPDNDPVVTSEQQRLQQLEMLMLTQGQAVPVSPRDAHRIHLDILHTAMESAAQEVQQNPATMPILEALATHANQHVALALEAGAEKDDYAEDVQFLDQVAAAIEQVKQLDQASQAVNQQAAQLGTPTIA